MSRCLYNSDFATFLYTDSASIYRILDDNYHGEALTTTSDAWKAEIDIMKNVVSSLHNADGQIIFEYDTKNFNGWTAQIIQHEIDHCNGILI